MIPERSEKGRAALDVFFDGHNDVHFYVEDTAYHNIYQAILRRLFPKVKVSQIFPLDGKPNVLRHAQDAAGNRVLSRPRVYILDKDFDDLLGRVVVLPGVFYLRRYCIENYLLEDESAVIECLIEHSPKQKRELVASRLRYASTLRAIVKETEPLFRLFFIVQAYGLGLPNAKQAPDRFVQDKNRGKYDRSKITAYRRSVLDALMAAGKVSCSSDLSKACAGAFPAAGSPDIHISGKFLLRMLRLRLAARGLMGSLDVDVMLYSLARNSRSRGLKELGVRVRRFLRAVHLKTANESGGAN